MLVKSKKEKEANEWAKKKEIRKISPLFNFETKERRNLLKFKRLYFLNSLLLLMLF